MLLWDRIKTLLDRRGLRASLGVAASYLARRRGRGVNKIFFDEEVWVHDTSQGYFAYRHPYVRLDLTELDRLAQEYFFWGYHPRPGGVVIDVGAGVGEEVTDFLPCRRRAWKASLHRSASSYLPLFGESGPLQPFEQCDPGSRRGH